MVESTETITTQFCTAQMINPLPSILFPRSKPIEDGIPVRGEVLQVQKEICDAQERWLKDMGITEDLVNDWPHRIMQKKISEGRLDTEYVLFRRGIRSGKWEPYPLKLQTGWYCDGDGRTIKVVSRMLPTELEAILSNVE